MVKFLWCCEPKNERMIVCLHRYLERDYKALKDLILIPPDQFFVGLEKNELRRMCLAFTEMRDCYANFYSECISFPNHAFLTRLVRSLDAVKKIACDDLETGLIEIFNESPCFQSTRHDSTCEDMLTRKMEDVFRESLRFNLPVGKFCPKFNKFIECKDQYSKRIRCKIDTFQKIFRAWTDAWCEPLY